VSRSVDLFYTHFFAASLALQPLVSLNIYRRCQDINLTSPVYFTNGGRWNVAPDQEIDVNAVMRNRIEFDSRQDILKGILTYRIHRQHTESDQSVQNESKCIWLLVVWRECTEGLHVHALLVEHDRELDWDENKLRELYQKCWYSLNAWINPTRNNWLLDDAVVLKTAIKVMNGGHRWNIFISEGSNDNTRKPLWIDVER
jgi:hypothetical protein